MNRYLSALLLVSILFVSCVSEEDHQKLGSDLKSAKDSLAKAQGNLDGQDKQIAEKDQKITELEDQVKILSEQNATFIDKNPQLEQEVADLQKKLDEVTRQRDEIKTSTAGSDTKIRQVGEELAAAKETIQKWRSDYETLLGTNANLKSRLNDLENRPRDDILFSNSLVRYLRQQKKIANASLEGLDDLSEEKQTVLASNKKLLAKSNKALTAEMGDYYTGKGTFDQMAQKYPDFAKKYQLILKMRAEASGGKN